jgi:hypothetical protein
MTAKVVDGFSDRCVAILYEKRDVRDKSKHPATFPISLAKKIIALFFFIRAN